MSTKIHHDVRAFHKKFGHPVRTTPTVPHEEEIRFRLRLITEEFLELFAACGIVDNNVEAILRQAIANAPIEIDLPELTDAMGDLDYVVEGTRATFGVDGAPIHNAIHHANMSKDPNGSDGKPVKPPGWLSPDIGGELKRQGWQG